VLTRLRLFLAPILVPIRKTLQRLDRAKRRWNGTELREKKDVRIPVLRLGSGDGEWTIARSSAPAIVYSFGVGKDIRFERDLLTRFPSSQVFAFDPTPIAIRWLKGQQLPPNFSFREWGIADTDGTARFSLPEGHHVSFVMGEGDVEAPVRKLSTIMNDLGHDRIDILKMDIEGAEYAVLEDILKNRPKIGQILIEFHHRMSGHTLQQTERAIEILRKAGYGIFDISPRGTEYGFIKNGA
jgi:FkbM family methyltransferase